MSNQNVMTWEKDPATNLMVDYSSPCPFTPQKKLDFVEAMRKGLCNVWKVCKDIGIGYPTYERHMAIDPVFKEMVDDARKQINHGVEEMLVQRALEGKSPMWTIYYLNNNWSSKYGPKLRLVGDKEDATSIFSKMGAIDVEVVKTVDIQPDNTSQATAGI